MSIKVLYLFLMFSLKLVNLIPVKTHENDAQTVRTSGVIHYGEALARQESRQVHCFSFNSDGIMGFSVQYRILCLGNLETRWRT